MEFCFNEFQIKGTIYAIQNVKSFGIDNEFKKKISYRPFDTKWTYFTKKSKGLVAFPVYDVMRHFVNTDNVGVIVSRINHNVNGGYIFITKSVMDLHILDNGAYVFPLYLKPEKNNDFTQPN